MTDVKVLFSLSLSEHLRNIVTCTKLTSLVYIFMGFFPGIGRQIRVAQSETSTALIREQIVQNFTGWSWHPSHTVSWQCVY